MTADGIERRLGAQRLWPWITAVTIISVAAAPLVWFKADVILAWFPWAAATAGTRPWGAYLKRADCNYPPITIYFFTLFERIRLTFSIFDRTRAAVLLVKMPVIVATAGLAVVCDRGLHQWLGPRRSRSTAVLIATSFPLFIDGALWGQFDGLLMLSAVAAVMALLCNKPLLSGILVGLALATKPQSILVLPTLSVYCLKKFGIAKTVASVSLALATVVALSVPILIGGAGPQLRGSFTGGADLFPQLSRHAANPWMLLLEVNQSLRHLPPQVANSDARLLIGRFTPKHIGILLMIAYTSAVMTRLWRRPTPTTFVAASAIVAFGFFMLLTQMHERYLLFSAVLYTLLAFRGRWGIYLTLNITSSANMLLWLVDSNLPGVVFRTMSYRRLNAAALIALAVINSIAFLIATWHFFSANPDAIDEMPRPAPCDALSPLMDGDAIKSWPVGAATT